MTNHDTGAPGPTTPQSFNDLNTPTAAEFQRVIVYVNGMVVDHLHESHGITVEQLRTATPEQAEDIYKQCDLAEVWSKILPVLGTVQLKLRAQEVAGQVGQSVSPSDAAGNVKLRGPLLLGKIGEA